MLTPGAGWGGSARCVAGLSYSSGAMVLDLGRLGETEAVFTLLVSSSLLVWHAGYLGGWRPELTWSAGYALAALAGLAKGPQGPVYFVVAVVAYLALRRDWRYLVGRPHAVGLATFAVVLGAWQVPYALQTNWASVRGIWMDNAAERFADGWQVVARHVLVYPAEMFVCLLPWSLPLLYLANRRFWRSLADVRPWVNFLLVAIVVCFPSVWFAGGAKARYFMPLFPLFGVLTGLVVERCWQLAPGDAPRRAWNAFLATMSLTALASAAVIAAATWLSNLELSIAALARAAQPPVFAGLYVLAALTAATVLWLARRESGARGWRRRRSPAWRRSWRCRRSAWRRTFGQPPARTRRPRLPASSSNCPRACGWSAWAASATRLRITSAT